MPKSPKLKPVVQARVETETLMALATNDTVTAAAEQLGISRTVIYERIHKYGLTEKLSDLQKAAQVELMTGAGKAARNLISKIDSQNEDISLKATTEALDRIGLTKPNNLRTDMPGINILNVVNSDRDKYGI